MSGWALAVAGISIGLGIGVGLDGVGRGLNGVGNGIRDVGTGVFRMAREDRQQLNKRLDALESKAILTGCPACGNSHAGARSSTAQCVSSLT